MTTKKGTYIRTCENRVFTVKMNDNSPSIWSPNISNYNNGNKIRSSIPYRTSQPTYVSFSLLFNHLLNYLNLGWNIR